MATASISCNLEALAVAGNGKINISHYKNPALRWNAFKFSAPLHSPQMNPQLKSVKRSRGGYGLCKVYVQCDASKEKGSPKQRKRVFGISPEKAIPIIMDCLVALHRPALIAILVGLLLVHDPEAAMAASGGRVGGKSFSSGRGSGSYSSRTFSAPSPSFSYSVPYAAPSPFGFGGGLFVRPAYGIGFGASSGIFLFIMGVLAVVFVSGFLTDRADTGLFVSSQKTSVLKLQVGLLGLARSIQKDLDRIAETANTSTPEGLNYVLTETVLALLRHPDFCISGYSSVDIKRSMEAGEERFNQLSIEERGKFNEETLVNISGIRKRSTGSQRSDVFSNEYIVVYILKFQSVLYKMAMRLDLMWEYVEPFEGHNRTKMRCKICGMTNSGGINRFKYHLAKLSEHDVVIFPTPPPDVVLIAKNAVLDIERKNAQRRAQRIEE